MKGSKDKKSKKDKKDKKGKKSTTPKHAPPPAGALGEINMSEVDDLHKAIAKVFGAPFLTRFHHTSGSKVPHPGDFTRAAQNFFSAFPNARGLSYKKKKKFVQENIPGVSSLFGLPRPH